MTEETEIRIPFTDLNRISFECNRCKAEITIDISKKEHRHIEKEDREHSMKCPFCGTAFDSQLRSSFKDFFNWHEKVKESGHTVYFRLKRG